MRNDRLAQCLDPLEKVGVATYAELAQIIKAKEEEAKRAHTEQMI